VGTAIVSTVLTVEISAICLDSSRRVIRPLYLTEA
jgi:hypothetical protein